VRAERHCDTVTLIPGSWFLDGGVAQLGERLLCKQEVDGSSPFTSTNPAPPDWWATGGTQFRREPGVGSTVLKRGSS
jgi:hypothetical protein